jgi:pimeloyl-ACP methyl ester carboxylesterase
VYGEYHAPPGRSRAAVLCLHGFNSDLREFGTFPAELAAHGFHVLAFDQRGFGQSGGERGRIGLDRVMSDIEGALAQLRARAGAHAHVAAVGHSLGGSYAIGMQARHGPFAALVVAHVTDRLFDETALPARPVLHALGRLNRRRVKKGRPSRQLRYWISYRRILRDRDARRAAKKVGFLLPSVNMGNYDFASTMQASSWAKKVRVPTLCVQSDHDPVVDARHSRVVYAALAGPHDDLAHDGGHSCFRDRDRALIVAGVAAWLRDRLGVSA